MASIRWEWILVRLTNRIHSYWFWRACYALFASGAFVRFVAWLLRRDADGTRTAALQFALVWSGWPRRYRAWINVNASQLVWRARRRAARRTPAARVRRGPRGERLRVACLGDFAALLTFQRELFAAAPDGVEVGVFDVPTKNDGATYLEPIVARYVSGGAERPARAAAVAAAISEWDPDLLLVVSWTAETYAVLDGAAAGCVLHVCTGSDLLHHENVDVHAYAQPEADYFVVGERLFCATSRSFVRDALVYGADLLYDGRGLDPSSRRPWSDREPLVVVHGSLYKTSAPEFLATILDLVAEDTETRAVFVGGGTDRERAAVRGAAERRGLQERVELHRPFSAVRGSAGDVDDRGWHELVDLLSRARLAADPWPVCGASTRVEAYGCGAPTVHLGVRFDEAAWGRAQPAVFELPALLVPEATAYTREAYTELCRRCLRDPGFADDVAARQAEVFRRVTDVDAYWTQLLELYRRWARKDA
jgi:hypothetical protein